MIAASIRWTAEVVAQRAAELLRAQGALRDAKYAYQYACQRYKERIGRDLDVSSPTFRRATRKSYGAYQQARIDGYNARRRFETAVRGSRAFMEAMR
ncbi:hypothetical protein [Burkholderia sp. 22313]|uniref:hypothetical protein n=1 Tax=Burkholderia sp. 22313 TaxID=3453908 RepID=UPI003F8634A0